MKLHSVGFRAIIEWLRDKGSRISVETLGGRSSIFCEYVNDHRILIIGSNGSYKIAGVRFWNAVCRRMNELNDDERQEAGNYSDTIGWSNPDHYFAPSIPAICKAYLKEHNCRDHS